MKKVLATILTLVMAIGLCSVSWATSTEPETAKAAEFNGQQYDTLLTAVQAAVNQNTTAEKTIKLLGNVTEDVADIEGLSNFKLTIDLNGYSYTGMIRKYHDLVVTDTSENKTGTAHFSYVMCNVLELQGGNIVIDDAVIYHATYLKGATVTINGGEYQYSSAANHTKAINFEEGSSLTINSGVFWTNDNLEQGGNTVISYGSYFVVGRVEQGSYTIRKTSKDNNTTLYFYDLSTAAKAASDGDTIELLADQTISRKVEIKNSVTVKGNGHTIALADTVKNLQVGSDQYGQGVFETSGDNKNTKIENVVFKDIDRQTVMIRAYVSGNNSTITVDNCTFDNVKALNVVRAASGTAVKCKLIVTDSTFKNCTVSMNGIIQIDSNSNGSNGMSEIKNNDFIGNKVGPANNVAVIYLSAPATVQNNYFDGNTTTANPDQKNGIIVTGTYAGGSEIEGNAFVSHTFTGGNGTGAVYGPKVGTSVKNNYYGTGIKHLDKAGEKFSEGPVASSYSGVGVNKSHSKSGYYYYQPTTDTKTDDTKGSPKTFDAGVGIYAVTAVLSATGMAWIAKKRGN